MDWWYEFGSYQYVDGIENQEESVDRKETHSKDWALEHNSVKSARKATGQGSLEGATSPIGEKPREKLPGR